MYEKLEKLSHHPYFKKYFKKLRDEDYIYMHDFIDELESMTIEQKKMAVYRSAMRENKPKNWRIVEELLSIVID